MTPYTHVHIYAYAVNAALDNNSIDIQFGTKIIHASYSYIF